MQITLPNYQTHTAFNRHVIRNVFIAYKSHFFSSVFTVYNCKQCFKRHSTSHDTGYLGYRLHNAVFFCSIVPAGFYNDNKSLYKNRSVCWFTARPNLEACYLV